MDGIDISEFQSTIPVGPWLFVVHKATEGNAYVDPQFPARFQKLTGLRGAYHYARPQASDAVTQANHFADTVLAAGFKPDVDLWQLDVEGTGNALVDGSTWRSWIDAFMAQATSRLGSRGFLYVGAYFFPTSIQPERYHWWLPDYGPNDGQLHPISSGANPVIHQYTSAGGLDRNVVNDQAAWDTIVPQSPVPPPGPLRNLYYAVKIALYPLRPGQNRQRLITFAQQRLNAHGISTPENGVYGQHMVEAVTKFKAAQGWRDTNGHVLGSHSIAVLLK